MEAGTDVLVPISLILPFDTLVKGILVQVLKEFHLQLLESYFLHNFLLWEHNLILGELGRIPRSHNNIRLQCIFYGVLLHFIGSLNWLLSSPIAL